MLFRRKRYNLNEVDRLTIQCSYRQGLQLNTAANRRAAPRIKPERIVAAGSLLTVVASERWSDVARWND